MLLIKEEQKDVKNYQHNSTYLGKWFFVIRGAFMKKINEENKIVSTETVDFFNRLCK